MANENDVDAATEVAKVIGFSAGAPGLEVAAARLATPYTVVVGRNGGGKSVLLGGVARGARRALGQESWGFVSRGHFALAFSHGGSAHAYAGTASAGRDEDGKVKPTWHERCDRSSDDGASTKLWSSDAGRFSSGVPIAVPATTSLLAVDADLVPTDLRAVVVALRRLVASITYIAAGLPSYGPSHLFFAQTPDVDDDGEVLAVGRGRGPDVSPRLDAMVRTLIRWAGLRPDNLDELRRILSRLGVCQALTVTAPSDADGTRFHEVEIDGRNLGLASDGTLRALEIVVALVDAGPGSLLLIEEPESGLHPALVSRLLAEFEMVSEHSQLVISTHDPRVVDRVGWEQLRIVQRVGDAIKVGELASDRRDELKAFLSHGTLGEFVFGVDDLEPEPSDDGPLLPILSTE